MRRGKQEAARLSRYKCSEKGLVGAAFRVELYLLGEGFDLEVVAVELQGLHRQRAQRRYHPCQSPKLTRRLATVVVDDDDSEDVSPKETAQQEYQGWWLSCTRSSRQLFGRFCTTASAWYYGTVPGEPLTISRAIAEAVPGTSVSSSVLDIQ
eukprot:645910-Rhodomonas_salina.1